MSPAAVRRFLGRVRTTPPLASAADGAVVDDPNPRYDRETVEVIDRVLAPGDPALDIGANEGSILRSIVARSPHGRHHAFEPLPGLAEALGRRFRSVTVHQCALADERGESTFHHVVTNPAYSGLRQRRYDRDGEQVELISVAVERLDDVVPSALPVRFVKIDVEGGELGVLQGGLELLARHRPVVVFEHGLGAADYYDTRPEQVYELFETCDYRTALMADWLTGNPDLSRDRFVDEFSTCRNYYFLAHPR